MSARQPSPIAEIAAFLLVPAACWGFVRIFASTADVRPIIAAAVTSGGLAVLTRRAGLGLLPSALASFLALAALVVRRFAPGTEQLLVLPTAESGTVLRQLVDDGVALFPEVKAPVEAQPPFTAAAMVAAWVMAFLTDWGANRLRLAFEPVLPAGLLFVFSAILGSGEHQVSSTVIFLLAVVAWALAQRYVGLSRHVVWLAVDRERGLASVTRAGLLVASLAVVAGLVVGPRLPGAGADEWLDWRVRNEAARRVVSPFVDIEERLVSNDTTVLFQVTADSPQYWRLAGLDIFEENVWKLEEQFVVVEGQLPGTIARTGPTRSVVQHFEIENLSTAWLPAAYAPAFIEVDGVEASWNSETGSLTVSSEDETSNGAVYDVTSLVADYSAADLVGAPETVPGEIAERYLTLPDDLTPQIALQADAVTAGIESRYEQMLALQQWFQTFDYSLNLGPRGDDPIETFLDERVGFCQQFSGTFALMARHLGAPARVAVGFTWGDPVEGRPGTYEVTSRHTHAWPEVWFEGLGWVAFEPTPGRGAPNAGYTNLPARQDSAVEPETEPTTPTSTTLPTDPATPTSVDLDDLLPEDGTVPPTSTTDGTSFAIPGRLLVAIGLLAAYAVAVPALARARRTRRRERATTADERIEVAWAEASEELASGFGLSRRPSETRSEFASRIGGDLRMPEGVLEELAALTTTARYRAPASVGAGPTEPTASPADDLRAARADELSELVAQRVRERSSAAQRLRRTLDPRSVIR